MLFIRLCAALLIMAIVWPLPATAQDKKVFNAESFTLQNGMQVVVVPNHRAPVVTHMVWYRVGAADEEPGKSGLAHFLEHLMFKGTETIPPGQFSKIVKSLGGQDNAFTSNDYTAYFQSIAVDHLEKVMTMEADRMRGLVLNEKDVKSERDVVIEERRQRTENDPRGYFTEQMKSTLFLNHPYGNPVIGWLSEVDALNKDDAGAFYKRWYAPNNAILVVSGDITTERLKPMAEKIYGSLAVTENLPERRWTRVPPLVGLPALTLEDPQLKQPALYRLYRAPSLSENKSEALALQVLENAMSGGATTRLYKHLVVEQKIATSVSLSYDPYHVSDSTIWVHAYPAPGVDMPALEATIDKELRALITDGIKDDELTQAKIRMIDAADYARDSLAGPAMVIGRALASGATLEDIEYWPRDIESVTAQQVQDVAKTYLNPDAMNKRPYVTGYMLPEEHKEEDQP